MSDIMYALGFFVEYADGGRVVVAVLCLLFIAYGILSCFYGYKIFKFITGVCGFIAGTVLGFVLALATGGPDASGLALIIPSILVGVIGAFLAVKLYYIGVFLIGAFFGGLLGFALTAASDSGVQWPVILLLAIVAGILSVIIRKIMIILSTSVSGAQTISTAFYILIYAISGYEHAWINNYLWIVLAVIGFCYQYSSSKKAPVDPVAAADGSISGPGSMGKSIGVLSRYKKPLIIACIVILVFMLFGPRMPLGLVLLVTAIAIGIYLAIDRNSAKNTVNNGTISVPAAGAGVMNGGGTVAAPGSTVAGTTTSASGADTPTGGNTAATVNSSLKTGSSDDNTENIIECAACHTMNNVGSRFCGQCGTSLESKTSNDTPDQGSF